MVRIYVIYEYDYTYMFIHIYSLYMYTYNDETATFIHILSIYWYQCCIAVHSVINSSWITITDEIPDCATISLNKYWDKGNRGKMDLLIIINTSTYF